MNRSRLIDTAQALVAGDRGLLAMDESTPTCDKRFAKLGIAQTEAMRRAYRDMIVTTPGLGRAISGAILYDETIRQQTLAGVPFAQALENAGIVPGIKVDGGTKPLAGFADEVVTEGLDGLRARLAEYAGMGARFAKWRAVIRIGAAIPSVGCIEANAHALARYAALCQEAGLVPIVEPEVLQDGTHSLEQSAKATGRALQAVYTELHDQRIDYRGTLLKPNMVLSGYSASSRAGIDEVADASLDVLSKHVPAAVPGIVFLSGGQTDEDATAHLNAMNARGPHPWELSFSYGRALQAPALKAWRGDEANVQAAQEAYGHRAKMNGLARSGEYSAEKEKEFAGVA